MNALSSDMRRELMEALLLLEDDCDVRAIVLTGGEYVFSAGMDIKEMSEILDEQIDDYFRSMVRYLSKIYTFRKPVVAAVGGIALGGGFNLAVVCDIIIASESAFSAIRLKFDESTFRPLMQWSAGHS